MLTRPIPSSGEELPVIGVGTWKAFDVGDAEPLRPLLRTLTSLGGSVVDSSPMYGRAETVIGDILEPGLFLATKVWTSGRANGIAQMESSMRKMRTERIDLMQVHNLLDVDTHLATLRDWKRARRIRYIGITHYTASAYRDVEAVLQREELDFLQINYSAAERSAEQRLLPLAKEKGVAVIANRPFAEGAILRRLTARPLPSWAAAIECTTWPQILLKFVLAHPSITCAIPGTGDAAHLRENIKAAEGPMPDEKLRALIVQAIG